MSGAAASLQLIHDELRQAFGLSIVVIGFGPQPQAAATNITLGNLDGSFIWKRSLFQFCDHPGAKLIARQPQALDAPAFEQVFASFFLPGLSSDDDLSTKHRSQQACT